MNKKKLLLTLYIVGYVLFFPFKLPISAPPALVSMTAYLVLFIIGIILYQTIFLKNLNWLTHNKLKSLFILALGWIGDMVAITLGSIVIEYSGVTETLINDSNIFLVKQAFSPFIIIVILGIIGSVVEELFYRQILITGFSKHIPSWFAILLSSFFFACVHMHALTINEFLLVTPHFFRVYF